MALRVAINAQLLSPGNSYRNAGVGQYILRLLEHLEPGPGETYLVFVPSHVDRASLRERAGVRYVASALPTRKPALRVLWEQTLLPVHIARLRADVVYSPVNVLPSASFRGHVVTVHDLSFVMYPASFGAAFDLR